MPYEFNAKECELRVLIYSFHCKPHTPDIHDVILFSNWSLAVRPVFGHLRSILIIVRFVRVHLCI